MSEEHTCPRCGAPLKMVSVRVLARSATSTINSPWEMNYDKEYEERQEPSDCVRCTGSY